MRPYIVRQGEHLLGIAARLGFDAQEVWAHADNDELRESRPSGQVLAPGDVLFVPEPEEIPCGIDPETTNRYRARMPRAMIRVHLRDGDEPLADEPYRLLGLRAIREGVTDADGLVEEEVPAHVSELRLALPNRDEEEMTLRLGHYDPAHTDAGVTQRLQGAGAHGDLEGVEYDTPGFQSRDDAEDDHAEAVRRFQRSQELEATGEVDDDTHAALEEHSGD